jgi:ATP-dependent helicase IRC3
MSGLAFTVDIQHSEDLAKEFVRQGINCFPISSNTPKAVRRSVVQTFKTGDPNGFPVLTSCDALSEGFDAEIAAVGMGTRPTKSPVVFQQQVGRVARPYPSPEDYLAALRRGERPWKKPYAIWLDFCDQSGRHDLCSLPSLFGLRAGFDLKGKSAKETVRQIEKLEEENPGLDLGEVTEVSQIPRLLRSHTERINLFQTPIVAREIQALSRLGWIRTGPDRYQVSSPTQHTTYLVTLNLLGRYDVFASHVGVRRFLESFPDLREAIGFADTLVPQEDRVVLSTEMAWRSAPCTHKQVQLLWDRSYAVRHGFTDAAQLYRHFRKLHRVGNARFSRGGVSGMIDLVLHRNL